MSVLQIYCPDCTGTGWIGGQGGDTCPRCNGTRFIPTLASLGTEPMPDIQKTIRKSITVTTTVEFDSDTIEKILAQAAGAPEHGWSVDRHGSYHDHATVTWSTTETKEEPGQ